MIRARARARARVRTRVRARVRARVTELVYQIRFTKGFWVSRTRKYFSSSSKQQQ